MSPTTIRPPGPARTLLLLAAAAALGAWAGSRLAGAFGELAAGPARTVDRRDARGARRAEGRPPAAVAAGGLGAARAEIQRIDPPAGQLAPLASSGPPPASGAAALALPPGPPEGDPAAARQLAAEMGRLVRDLEFNDGLREPPQQLVVRPPAPWRPDSGVAGLAPPAIDAVEPRAAPVSGGARVTLRGRNFRAPQVMFGTAAARVVGGSAEAVIVIAPPGAAGPAVISLTNADGSYAVASGPFVYER